MNPNATESDGTKHIQRTFIKGRDHFPDYSTLELLVGGFCHLVGYSEQKLKFHPGDRSRGNAASAATRKAAAHQHLVTHFDTIKHMLAAQASNQVIAKAIGVSVTSLKRRINQSAELQALSSRRTGYGADSPHVRFKAKRMMEAA